MSQYQLRTESIEIDEVTQRMLYNAVYDEINMNSFNFINATFDDLFFRFPTQAEFDDAYEVVEFIGRWSMIDVFVVAILSALVQLDTIATINPGIAAVSFALSVVFTMLSAQAFDSRLIWDADRMQP